MDCNFDQETKELRLRHSVLEIVGKINLDFLPHFPHSHSSAHLVFSLLNIFSSLTIPECACDSMRQATRPTSQLLHGHRHLFMDPVNHQLTCFVCGQPNCSINCVRHSLDDSDACRNSFNFLVTLADTHRCYGRILSGIGFSSDQVVATLFKMTRNHNSHHGPPMKECLDELHKVWELKLTSNDWRHRMQLEDATFGLENLLDAFTDLLPLRVRAPRCEESHRNGRLIQLRCLGRADQHCCLDCALELHQNLENQGVGSSFSSAGGDGGGGSLTGGVKFRHRCCVCNVERPCPLLLVACGHLCLECVADLHLATGMLKNGMRFSL